MPCQPFPKGATLQSVCRRLLACSPHQGSSDTDHKVGPLPSAAPTTSASRLQLTEVLQMVPLAMHILSFFCYSMNFGKKTPGKFYNLHWNGSLKGKRGKRKTHHHHLGTSKSHIKQELKVEWETSILTFCILNILILSSARLEQWVYDYSLPPDISNTSTQDWHVSGI